jgi:hypothetical protein
LKHSVYILALFFSFILKGQAQYFDDDARLWLNVNLTKNFKKGLEAQLLLQNRMNNNMRQYNGYLTGSVAYRLSKHFKILGGYVIGAKQEFDGNFSPIQQGFAGIMLRQKIKGFLILYRNLTQIQIKGFSDDYDRGVTRLFNRNKITLKYELTKRWQAFISGEIYLTLASHFRYEEIGRCRYIGGLAYKISKKQSLEPFFLFQRTYSYKSMPQRNFVYGLTYNREF